MNQLAARITSSIVERLELLHWSMLDGVRHFGGCQYSILVAGIELCCAIGAV